MKKILIILFIMCSIFTWNTYAEDSLKLSIVPSGVDLGINYSKMISDFSMEVNGIKIPNDKVVQFLEMSANNGYSANAYLLSVFYEHGMIVDQDPVKSFNWLLKAYNQGKKTCALPLGCYYLVGFGVETDYEKAVKYFQEITTETLTDESSKIRLSEAYNNLGYCYYNGKGLTKDDDKALSMFSKAAELGDSVANYNIGFCYSFGVGTPIDKEKSVDALIKSAKSGYAQAQYLLGKNFYQDNNVEAITYLNDALNNEKCLDIIKGDILRILSACYRFGRCGLEIDIDKAESLIEEAASYGDNYALLIQEWLESNYTNLQK